MTLRKDINLGTLLALPPASRGWRADRPSTLAMLREAGFEGVQDWSGFDQIARAGLEPIGLARARQPGELDDIARRHADQGLRFTTLHLGTGFEDDAEMDALAAALLEAQARHGQALHVETHRATATQDIWRTLRWIERWPALRFTGDLSHWYTGHELTYGGEFAQRSARLGPVMDRVRSLHGRIGNSGCLQTPLDTPGEHLAHWEALWTRACLGFLRHASPGETLSFAPELLPMKAGEPPLWLNYQQARPHAADDPWRGEPCDRWADAQALWALVQSCHAAAQSLLQEETA